MWSMPQAGSVVRRTWPGFLSLIRAEAHMRFVPDGPGTQVYLVEVAGRERSHPLGEPEGRAACVHRLFWSGPLEPSRKTGGGGRSGVKCKGGGHSLRVFVQGFLGKSPRNSRQWPVGSAPCICRIWRARRASCVCLVGAPRAVKEDRWRRENHQTEKNEQDNPYCMPEFDFGGMLRRSTEGTAKLKPNDPCPGDPQWLLTDYLGGL